MRGVAIGSPLLAHLPFAREALRAEEEGVAAPEHVDDVERAHQARFFILVFKGQRSKEIGLQHILRHNFGEEDASLLVRVAISVDVPDELEGGANEIWRKRRIQDAPVLWPLLDEFDGDFGQRFRAGDADGDGYARLPQHCQKRDGPLIKRKASRELYVAGLIEFYWPC